MARLVSWERRARGSFGVFLNESINLNGHRSNAKKNLNALELSLYRLNKHVLHRSLRAQPKVVLRLQSWSYPKFQFGN